MPSTCRACQKPVLSDNIRIQCSACQCYYHGSCVCMNANDINYVVDNGESWLCAACTKDTRVLRSGSGGSSTLPVKKSTSQPITLEKFNLMMSTLNAVAADVASIRSTQDNILADIASIRSAQENIVTEIAKCNVALREHSETLQQHAGLISDCRADLAAVSSANASVVAEVEQLNVAIVGIRSQLSVTPRSSSSDEEFAREIAERIKRAHNLILRRLPEVSGSGSGSTSDYDRVCDVLRVIDADSISSICSVSRVGGGSGSRSGRPLKICFNNSTTPLRILRSKTKLRETQFRDLVVQDDMTPGQQRLLVRLRNELKQKHDSGDPNWTIKYMKGVPTIVPVDVKN